MDKHYHFHGTENLLSILKLHLQYLKYVLQSYILGGQ